MRAAAILGKHGFDPEEWEEIRLDVASVQPDIIGTMTDIERMLQPDP